MSISYNIFDIAVNPTYYSFEKLKLIVEKAKELKILPLFIGLDMETNIQVIHLSKMQQTLCYCGIHPTHINTLYKENNIWNILDIVQADLKQLFVENSEYIIAIGECGLDYYRNQLKIEQQRIFKMQLELSYLNIPYFLHMRNAFDDFYNIIKNYTNVTGVIHSFDGTVDQALALINLGFYIGINGCSLKNNIDLVKNIPIDKILVETDSPFCLIRKSYAGAEYGKVLKVKENEPVYILNLIEIISNIKQMPIQQLIHQFKLNTIKCFPQLKKFQ